MDGVTILVVDDDSSTRHSVARALGGAARSVTEVESNAAARALDGTFDVGVFGIEVGSASQIELAEDLLQQGRIGQAVFFSEAMWQGPLRRAAALGPIVPRDSGAAVLAEELRRVVASRAAIRA
jgi:DNA-binding NarL/FixJ family response regulator